MQHLLDELAAAGFTDAHGNPMTEYECYNTLRQALEAETAQFWVVVSNTDLVEGRGRPIYQHYCYLRSTAIRLANGLGVQGSVAPVRLVTLVRGTNGSWYNPDGSIIPVMPTQADQLAEHANLERDRVVQLAIDAGLTEEEIEVLRSK